MKITVYTISDCQFSAQEKEYLKAKNLQFEEKNLETNRDFLTEMLAVSNNFAGTPVTKIEKDDGQIVVLKGFTKEEFDKALGFDNVSVGMAAPGSADTQTPPPVAQPSQPSIGAPNVPDMAAPVAAPIPTPDTTAPAPVTPTMTVDTSAQTPTAPAPNIDETLNKLSSAMGTDMPTNPVPTAPTMDMSQPAMTPPTQPVPEQAPSMSVDTGVVAPQPMNTMNPQPVAVQPATPPAQDTAALNNILNDLQAKVDTTAPQAPTPQQPAAAAPTTPTIN